VTWGGFAERCARRESASARSAVTQARHRTDDLFGWSIKAFVIETSAGRRRLAYDHLLAAVCYVTHAESEITAGLVRDLLRTQHPDLAHLPV
jgi:hypothetical protein